MRRTVFEISDTCGDSRMLKKRSFLSRARRRRVKLVEASRARRRWAELVEGSVASYAVSVVAHHISMQYFK